MARPPRLVVPGQPLHLVQRGNNRSRCFLDSEDYERYYQALCVSSRRYGCAVHAYVLMTNHVHLLMTPDNADGPASMMQMVGRCYVRSFNARHKRSGTLWEGRYRSALIDSDHYLLACSRYIELNPVRAGIVSTAGQYAWSSYRHNAEGVADPLIAAHPLYRLLGVDGVERRTAYRKLIGTGLEPEAVNAIRRATVGGTILGDSLFRERLEQMLHRTLTPYSDPLL